MFLDWKNQYHQNDYTTQSNLQIECNPYQITNGIFFFFYRIRTKIFYNLFSSVTQLCPTICDPMNNRMPGPPVHHQLPESSQTHVHQVNDAIQPSHPLLSPSPPALNLSWHQGLLQ